MPQKFRIINHLNGCHSQNVISFPCASLLIFSIPGKFDKIVIKMSNSYSFFGGRGPREGWHD